MSSTKKAARVAGLLYLVISMPAVFGLLYVPNRLIVSRDIAATARNITAFPTLFRAGIVADLLGQAGFIVVAFALYRLFEGVNRRLGALMVTLISVSIPIAFVAELHHLAILPLLDPSGPAAALSEVQRNAHISMSLAGYSAGMLAAEIFWGVWLFPLALLVIRSGFLPKFLGVLLFVAGFAYVAESLTRLLLPGFGHAISAVAGPLRSLELVTPLWLLIFGAKDRSLPV